MATVLVIDPATSVRETLRIVFSSEHEVQVAATADETTAAGRPDVIVLGLPPPPRDERTAGRSLARWPDVPLLLLHAPEDVTLRDLAAPTRVVEFLPKPFDAYDLRTRLRRLLAASRPARVAPDVVEAHRRYLEYPFVSATAAALLRRAVEVDVPVLLHGEPGTGAPAIARALHALAGTGPVKTFDLAGVAQDDASIRNAALPEGGGTLFVANLEQASLGVQYELLAIGQRPADHGRWRIIAATRRDLAPLVAAGRFLTELAQGLGVLTIPLAPLRERLTDLPALVEMLTRELAARLNLGTVQYATATLARLEDYLWFGNVAELEAVLWRTLALHQSRRVEPEQLVFLPEHATRLAPPSEGRVPSSPPLESADALATPSLEILLGELAHELKNPMVTIKTFTQRLDSVLADPEVRTQFSTLTAEAVARMDGLLETLLDFARFRAPIPRSTDVRAMLDRVLGEYADDLTRRHVNVERNGTSAVTVDVDEAQTLFALRSLVGGLIEDLTPHAPIKVRGLAAGVLELEAHTEASVATRLAAYVEPEAGATSAESPPLAWALAAALLKRNAGAISVRRTEDAATVIRVDWGRRAT